MSTAASAGAGVVVPIRAFAGGKSRLAPYLPPAERERLLRAMADRVLASAGDLPVVVVSSAPEVVAWARGRGADVVADPGSLDAAASAGREHLRGSGLTRVLVVHADLPLVDRLDGLLSTPDGRPARERPVLVAVPCHREDGTPALSLPAPAAFGFAYGPGSFRRHVGEARRLGLEVVERRDEPGLRQDVDSLDDLELLARSEAG